LKPIAGDASTGERAAKQADTDFRANPLSIPEDRGDDFGSFKSSLARLEPC
jgi:hypothetical protein